jgi:hypothetical protein
MYKSQLIAHKGANGWFYRITRVSFMVIYIFIGSKYIVVKNMHIVPSKPCFWYAIEPMDCITAARLPTKTQHHQM